MQKNRPFANKNSALRHRTVDALEHLPFHRVMIVAASESQTMGIFNLFKNDQLSEKKIAKIGKLITNPFAQPDVRMTEMHRLVRDGTDGSYRALLKRLSINSNGHIADEDEKKWLEDMLVDLGDEILGPLEDYINQEKQLTYALRAYRRIRGDEHALTFFLKVLHRYGPLNYRAVEAKLQLVNQLLTESDLEKNLAELTPFLLDHSDDIRWLIMDAIEKIAGQTPKCENLYGQAIPHLIEIICDESAGPRIQKRAAQIIAEFEWAITEPHEDLSSIVAEQYFIDKKNFLRKRARPQ